MQGIGDSEAVTIPSPDGRTVVRIRKSGSCTEDLLRPWEDLWLFMRDTAILRLQRRNQENNTPASLSSLPWIFCQTSPLPEPNQTPEGKGAPMIRSAGQSPWEEGMEWKVERGSGGTNRRHPAHVTMVSVVEWVPKAGRRKNYGKVLETIYLQIILTVCIYPFQLPQIQVHHKCKIQGAGIRPSEIHFIIKSCSPKEEMPIISDSKTGCLAFCRIQKIFIYIILCESLINLGRYLGW